MTKFGIEQAAVAVGLSVVGLAVAAGIMWRWPWSVARWVDRKVDEAVTLPAPGVRVSS